MADDWDLAAVVRSCKTDASSAAASAAAADTGRSTGLPSDALSCLASLTFEEEKDQFSFPNIIHQNDDQYYSSRTGYTNHGFQELQQLIKPIIFCKNDTIGGGASSVPSSSSLNHINIGQQHHHHHLRHVNIIRPTPPPPNNNFNLRPASDFGGFIQGMQKRELDQSLQEQQPNHPVPSNIPAFLNSQPQATRIRKRKSQQKRTVCHVTAENLSNDVWAWRKYGQKPIKGSPYPRNYYRCSSSKGCPARKQVERSNTDPNIFVITYSGDHTHPRPTHRNSLAGSTRHKYSSQPEKELPAPSKLSPDPDHIMPTNSSSLSPTTPLRVLKEELADRPHQATHLKETITTTSIDAGDQDMDINIDDDPNQVLDQELIMADSDDQEDGSMMEMSASTDHDDIFLGLQELDSSPI